jgi:hypothetical protein
VGLGKLYNGARKWNKAAHGKSIFSAAATACRDEAGVENHHPSVSGISPKLLKRAPRAEFPAPPTSAQEAVDAKLAMLTACSSLSTQLGPKSDQFNICRGELAFPFATQ